LGTGPIFSIKKWGLSPINYPFNSGLVVEENIKRKKEESTVGQKKLVVHLPAEAAKTTAFNVYPPNHCHNDKDKKSREETE
jgi:hypothetical protein